MPLDDVEQLKSRSYLSNVNTSTPFSVRDYEAPKDFAIRDYKGPQTEQSWFDATVGAVGYGAADTAELLTKNLGATLNSDYLKSVADDLQSFKDNHPEYAPTEVRDVFDLITNPKAITSRVFGAAPYLLATVGGEALPGGPFLTMGLIYGIESQRSFDSAKRSGASDEEANTAARIGGVVNTLLQTGAGLGVLKFAKGGVGEIAAKAIEDASGLVKASSATGGAVNFLAKQAVIGTLQGTANELVPLGVYSKNIEGGVGQFIDRRLQDAFGAAVTGAVFGALGKGLFATIGKDGQVSQETNLSEGKVVDAFSRDSLASALVINRAVPAERASIVAGLVDTLATKWSQRNGLPKEQYYATHDLEALAGSKTPVEGPLPDASKGESSQVPPKSPTSQDLMATSSAIEDAFKVEHEPMGTNFSKPKETPKVDISGKVVGEAVQTGEVIGDLWNVFKRELSPEDYLKLQKLYPQTKSGGGGPLEYQGGKVKKVEAEVSTSDENITQSFQRYLFEGNAPHSELIDTFAGFKDWMKDVYGTLRASGVEMKLKPFAKQMFDNVLAEYNPTVQGKVDFVNGIQKQIEVLTKASKTKTGGEQLYYKDQIQQLQKQLKTSNVELQTLKEAQFKVDGVTESDLQVANQDKFVHESEMSRQDRNLIQRARDTVGSWISMATPLKRFAAGQETLDSYNNFTARARLHVGEWEPKIVDAFGQLTREERLWLAKTNEYGETNLQSAFDGTARKTIDSSTLSPAIQNYGKLLGDINQYFAGVAKEVGIQQKRADGSVVPFEQADGQRIPRVMMADARKAVLERSGPIYEALRDYIAENNGMSLEEAESALGNDYGEATTKRSSSLEYTRKIQNMPSVLKINGSDVAIMHTEPLDLARRAVEYQAMRSEWVREFGQGVLSNVEVPQIRKFASLVGVDFGVTKAKLRGALEEAGLYRNEMSWEDMKSVAKDAQIDIGMSKEELQNSILQSSAADIGRRKEAQLREFAKAIGGVKLDEAGVPVSKVDLLNNLKTRMLEFQSDKFKKLATDYVKQGGDVEDFMNVAKVAQGLPYGWLGRSTGMQSIKFASSILSAMQTSLKAIPHFTQSMMQVPQMAGVSEFLSGFQKALLDPKAVESDVTSLGVIHRTQMTMQSEPGYSLEGVGAKLNQLASKAGLFEWVQGLNTRIAGEAFRQKALDWSSNGINEKEIPVAKSLGLNTAEIQTLLDIKGGGKTTLSDQAFAKIVQNGVAKTVFIGENNYNKGALENLPLARMVLSYSSYMLGTTRTNFELVKDLRDAVKNKDVAGMVEGVKRTALMLTGAVGAGLTANALRQAFKSQNAAQSVDDESFWNQAMGALNETAALGMVHRFTDAFKYDGGIPERTAFSLAPQLGAVVRMVGAVAGEGKFAEFPLSERLGKTVEDQTPEVKSVLGWLDLMANPEKVQYDEARIASKKFIAKASGQSGTNNDSPVNPEYYGTFLKAQRFDLDGAVSEAKDFYKDVVAKKGDLEKAILGLRGSLVARSPVDLSQENMLMFLRSLPQDQRRQFLKTQVKYMSIVNAVAPAMGS